MVKYFDSDPLGHDFSQLDYQDFMSVVLPCAEPYLRAAATQRPANKTSATQRLEFSVEDELAILLRMEADFLLRLEQMKANLEFLPGFDIKTSFKAIDEFNNKYIDEFALRRFFKKMGHTPLKLEMVAIMRRFDVDGDA